MELAEFVDNKRPKWEALENLLHQAETKGLKSFDLDEARSLSRLYRGASSDLLWVRSRGGSADVSGYLNDLVARAYAITYPGKPVRGKEVLRFLTHGFPDVMRKEWRAYVASVLLFVGGGAFGWLGMVFDPDAAPYLVPEQHLHLDPNKRAEDAAKHNTASVQEQAAFSSFLFTHNISVAFLAFALGLTAGIGTAIALFANGLMLGSLAWVYSSKGMTGWFWAWILPHGIPEISAICIAGAAGFVMARALVAPRGLSRRKALRKEAATALKMLLGTLALFVLAGCIEGTISQIHPPKLSVLFKISFALVVGGGVYAYILSAFFRPGDRSDAKA
ncbi:MAG: stage II sporulation protein M [Myxococcaceae bacterium]